MNIFYGLDNTLINEATNKFIDAKIKNNNYAPANIYYLDQETINDQIIQILHEVSTINIFNQKKVIVINDYYSVLKNNLTLANNLFDCWHKFNDNLIVIKFLTNEINFLNLEKSVNYNLIKSYNKQQLKKWIINKANEYKLNLNEIATELMISIYPNNLTIIDNELKKLKNLNQNLTLEIIKNNGNQHFNANVYKLIDALLVQNYLQFWTEYRKYWQRINYDNYNIFSLLVIRLELIRNLKILQKVKADDKEIMQKLNLSVLQYKSLLKYKFDIKKLNDLLKLAYNINFKIKNGKTNKNITIELFFLKI